jgi:sugar lactone lactonase YvrE
MRILVFSLVGLLTLAGCSKEPFEENEKPAPVAEHDPFELVASSEFQWTGVGVTLFSRVFVNFPRWGQDIPMSLAQVKEGELHPYPDESWNSWSGETNALSEKWVAVQSVVTDREYRIWVLDTGNPQFEGVMEGAPKLVGIDPDTREPFQSIEFSSPIVQEDSYLNDVRVDDEEGRAYITDSGNGALIVVDLETGKQWRVLDEHESTHSSGADVTIDGRTWMDGERDVHADGIALHQGHWLYYKALTGSMLYRLPLDVLRADELNEEDIANAVEPVADIGPTDGLITDSLGRVYYTDIDDSAIGWYSPDNDAQGTVLSSPRLAWPDSLACQNDSLYVTTSRIHEGSNPSGPYELLKVQADLHCP